MDRFRDKIRQIYAIAAELAEMFPGRKFTPDGHMVGSIGEAIAKIDYEVKLFPTNHPGTDGTINGREVQIKATQGKDIAVKKPCAGDLLLVMKITPDGRWEKIYDGDARRVWDALKNNKESYMREKTISLNRLRKLQSDVDIHDRIPLRKNK